ncbi:acyltransferase [Streptomyces sp. NBC_00102]|uniref:acyltransferase family protein n=1 Tax=Streptomyces sp. NBC_00102 TaxID=2975652 RepID=UPI002253CD18|nr:acyltransferase [Streptomyces sp. NBC_00102]MCX5399879.1 acyltransferase [Streptomyces sp. NBC_00102]
MGRETATAPQRGGRDLPALTGIRFFAALLVFLAHASLLYNPLDLSVPINLFRDRTIADNMAKIFAPAGFVGVSFFFVLSGFVLTWSRREKDTATGFWRRRLLKIFPNHLVTWALTMFLFAAAYTPMHAWLPNLFLLHSFSPQSDTNNSVNVPAWSLCSELLFYLLFPVIIRPLARIADRRLWFWAGGAVAGVAVIALLARYVIPAGQSFPLAPLPMTKMWFGYLFPPSRLFEFVLGILLARIVMAGLWPRIGAWPIAVLALAGYVAAVEVPSPYNFSLTTIVPVSAIICAVASHDARGGKSVLNHPFLVWLGTVSFGMYMGQVIPIFYGRLKLLGGDTYSTPAALGLLLLLLASCVLLGWLLHTLVEAPVMRRWGRSRPKPGPTPTPSAGRSTDPAASTPVTPGTPI